MYCSTGQWNADIESSPPPPVLPSRKPFIMKNLISILMAKIILFANFLVPSAAKPIHI